MGPLFPRPQHVARCAHQAEATSKIHQNNPAASPSPSSTANGYSSLLLPAVCMCVPCMRVVGVEEKTGHINISRPLSRHHRGSGKIRGIPSGSRSHQYLGLSLSLPTQRSQFKVLFFFNSRSPSPAGRRRGRSTPERHRHRRHFFPRHVFQPSVQPHTRT